MCQGHTVELALQNHGQGWLSWAHMSSALLLSRLLRQFPGRLTLNPPIFTQVWIPHMSHEETRAHLRKIWKLSVHNGAWGSLAQLTIVSPTSFSGEKKEGWVSKGLTIGQNWS